MDKIEKALQTLQEAVDGNGSVKRITVTITLAKPSKAKPDK